MMLEEDDTEFVNRSKARFRRRLQDRWVCDIPAHTHCYMDPGGTHIVLTEEAINGWVSALVRLLLTTIWFLMEACSLSTIFTQHNGEATLLSPPVGLLPSKLESESASIRSMSSSNTTEYRQHFRWQTNPSLMDLRLAKNELRQSLTSLSSSELSSSTASSVVPGIGYMSGKVVKWVGLQILDGLGALEIRRRRWIIRRLMAQMSAVPESQIETWVMKREAQVNHTIEDLVELTSYVL